MNLHLTFDKYITHQHPFENDYEGKVITTLIESRGNKKEHKQTILYIHGFCDYFFQIHLMDYFNEHGVNFYAIDLRKYGRSLLPHQHPNYCKSMREYFPDIDYGIEYILKENRDTQLFLLGHSTGGLLATYYAMFGLLKERLSGLILNSPFFDFNVPFYVKPFMGSVARSKVSKDIFANAEQMPELYGKTLHKDHEGEWEYKKEWKPINPFAVYYSWILAVQHTQELIQEVVLHEDFPILLMYSDKSGSTSKWTATSMTSDIVLNVKDIEKIGSKIGHRVEKAVIEDGMHDLFLSKKEVRNKAMFSVLQFLEKHR
ncbi:alpha/beta hydrolase [Myroides odoratimimus]|uniref:Alpha/beta hydrolase n=1 Tax=Myroides odoratimimus TaxID=76832 RepID=A0AAI8G3P9_9FLAO|nr:alpha/beta hydrolase [Myroides odoratimimus]ALU24898.1 alpha/beta hydrolase [Myroides odoratimimus]MDM1537639.1 alpha/beta hydrolase [Myroides odoratimimus]MDM1677161.1 alpha/beta hydrolase [Myroides odoratimimus]